MTRNSNMINTGAVTSQRTNFASSGFGVTRIIKRESHPKKRHGIEIKNE